MRRFNVNLRGRIGNTGVLECWSVGVLEDAFVFQLRKTGL